MDAGPCHESKTWKSKEAYLIFASRPVLMDGTIFKAITDLFPSDASVPILAWKFLLFTLACLKKY